MWNALGKLFNQSWFHFITLFAFALVLNKEGAWAPGGNENIYMLYAYKAYHHSFLATDWTFQESTAGHLVFNYLFGWPTLFLPLKVFIWIGRIASWSVLLVALIRIGGHFKIPRWMIWLGILLWLIQRQAFVANEWIIGTFEAKCIAYICLLFAIDGLLRGRLILPAILTGLVFSFHSAIGLWGGVALGLTVLTQKPIASTIKFFAIAFVFALPGAIASWWMVTGAHAITADEAKYLVLIEMPFHLDPRVFGAGKIAILFSMLAFNVLHYRQHRDDEKLGFLIRFEIAAGACFALGIFFRLAHQFTLVELFPFRVFAVLIMLLFFWHLAAVYYHRSEVKPSPLMITLGIFLMLALPSPIARLSSLADDQLPKWRHNPDADFIAAASYVRDHYSGEADRNKIVIAPPWEKGAFYWTQHPLIADWHVPRFTAMTEWRERCEALIGDQSNLKPSDNLAGTLDDAAHAYFANLSPADIAEIRRKYGGDLLITTSLTYPYHCVFQSGEYRVYWLD